ncbi:MAG TPA: lysylphosphatidylglycerol synthase domain-containing protein [Rhizobiaceae bacterium]|nr:lysylphosphatidylglycerol synthase domain-containing protein [Rhizobiaceae bacterium]
MKWRKFIWPVIGSAAVVLSIWLLFHELRGLSLNDIWDELTQIPPHRYLLALGSACVAYAALAGYDHIALLHIGKRVSFLFVSLCSFTTYALSHNIGGSVFSGAVIRYRAYGSRGLSAQEVGVLVAMCWFTFILATVFTFGIVLILEPDLFDRFGDALPWFVTSIGGGVLLALVALYVYGSWVHFRPLKIGAFEVYYPRLPIVWRQLTIGPLELLGAAGILYFALPADGNPGFIVVLGVFLVAFSIASITHAPGGIGVFEYVALKGLSTMDEAQVMAALIVFRLFYLIIPLIIALVVVVIFERGQYGKEATARPPG